MNRNKSYGINGVVDKLFKKQHLSLNEIQLFQETSPIDFLGALADELKRKVDVRYRIEKKVRWIPQLLSTFLEEIPDGFSRLGVNTEQYKFKIKEKYYARLDEKRKKEIIEKNITTKIDFNNRIDQDIIESDEFKLMTEDMDILTESETLPKEYRDKRYMQIPKNRIDALKLAGQKRNAEREVCMKVTERDGTPYAKENALKLSKIRVKVTNYPEYADERFILIRLPSTSSRLNEYLEAMINKTSLQEISKITGIEQQKIKKFRSGENLPSFEEAKAMELYYNEMFGTSEKFASPKKIVYPIYRQVFEDFKRKTAELPQVHRSFYGLRIEGYTRLYNLFEDHFELSRAQSIQTYGELAYVIA